MNDYSDDYIDTVVDYLYEGKVIDRYSPAEYTESIDAGGNEAVLDNIGFGSEDLLSESGETSGKTGIKREGIEGLPERTGNKGRGDSGDSSNVPSRRTAQKGEGYSRKLYGQKGIDSKRSDSEVMVNELFSAITPYAPAREEADGRRFLEALKNGDKKTARELLNIKAKSKGYEPIYLYHGTKKDVRLTRIL